MDWRQLWSMRILLKCWLQTIKSIFDDYESKKMGLFSKQLAPHAPSRKILKIGKEKKKKKKKCMRIRIFRGWGEKMMCMLINLWLGVGMAPWWNHSSFYMHEPTSFINNFIKMCKSTLIFVQPLIWLVFNNFHSLTKI